MKEILDIANDFFKNHKVEKLVIKKISFYYIKEITVLVQGTNETLEIVFNYSSSFKGNTKEWLNPQLNLKIVDRDWHSGHRTITQTHFVLEDVHNNFSLTSSNCYLQKQNLCNSVNLNINKPIKISESTLFSYNKLLEDYNNKRIRIMNSGICSKKSFLNIFIEQYSNTYLYQRQKSISNSLNDSYQNASYDSEKLKIECDEPVYLNFLFFNFSEVDSSDLKLTVDKNLYKISNKDETFNIICKSITMNITDLY